MQTQRCETCGQDWWDAHACPLKMTAAAPAPTLGTRIDFPTLKERDEWLKKHMPVTIGACACVGPQNGRPLCPCAMRGVIVRDGRYIVPERDLGPAA